MKKVSVIVPVYNAESRLELCLDSIIAQTYPEIEILLVDDGSKDKSGEICDRYAKKDRRFKVFHIENGGVSAARNYALGYAQGDYVQFLDSDDSLYPETISEKVNAIENQQCEMVVTAYNRESANVNDIISYDISGLHDIENYTYFFSKEEAHSYFFGVLWNKLYDAEILRKNNIRFSHKLSFAEDFVFNLEYMQYCKNVFIIQKPLYNYYFVFGTSSLSKNNSVFEQTWEIRRGTLYKYYKEFFKTMGWYEKYRNLVESYLFISFSRSIYDLFLAGKSIWFVRKVINKRRSEPEIHEMSEIFKPYNSKQKLMITMLKLKADFLLTILFMINHKKRERIKKKQFSGVK